jgi:hypothetical protein
VKRAVEKLETIVIDIPNKKFEINHTPIRENCSNLIIEFDNGVWSVTECDKYFVDGKALRDEFGNKVGNLD